MFIHRLNFKALMFALVATSFLVACSGKKMAKVTPPVAAPALPKPTASLSANPDVIQQGQSAVLTWQTGNAAEITIEGLGPVAASGSRSVSPSSSHTYTLVAKGAGGTGQASARITVNAAAVQLTPPDDVGLFAKNIRDVFFDFDDAKIRTDQASTTRNDGNFLSQHSNVSVLIEGHCDDRGSEIYNLALGDKRANTVKEALIQQGVDASRIKTVSYGKEKPFCAEENEQCWQQNRRDHLVVQR